MILRAAIHVHSDWSYDGRWPLERVARAFADRGYDALLMTEHDLGFNEDRRRAHREACQKASTDRMVVVPGIEYSDPTNKIHTLVWGNVPFLGANQETQSVLEKAAVHDAVCVLAHPSRRDAWRLFRHDWLRYLAAIEIWNRKTDGWAPSREALKLAADTGAPSIVGLDFHSAKQFFPLAVQVPVEGKANEVKILDALRYHTYRCDAFGIDLDAFTAGIGLSASRVLEAGRRFAARTVRSVISRRPNTAGPDISAPPASAAAFPEVPVEGANRRC